MNLDKLKRLYDVVEDKPVRLRDTYLSKFPDLYNEIITYTNFDIPLIQKIWYWANDKKEQYTCKCGNTTTFKKNWKDGYTKYCSSKCAQTEQSTKNKRKSTNIERWGVDNVSKNKIIRDKQNKTNLEKYGHISSFQNEEVKNKWKKNIKEKYGVDHYFKTDEFKVKAKTYYLEKWGVEHPLNVEEIKQKIKSTCLSKYGVDSYLKTEDSRKNIKKYNTSSYEKELYEWVTNLGFECQQSARILKNKTVDLYLPDKKLAIEINGLYWHSELFKDKDYHLSKTIECSELGIHLIHIWEDDWLNNKEIVKSLIKNKLDIIDNRIYARKCKIQEITDNSISSDFLNKNHIQGWTKSTYTYGLYYLDELVSIMSFGYRYINGKKEFELIRFCNKIDCSVIGSANKLFKYFLNNNDVDTIITYADRSMFDGKVYEKMGFNFVKHSGVNYWWVVEGIRRHRFSFTKSKLVKRGYDRTLTEVEIMHSIGNFRIWGCGQDRWLYCRK